MMEWLLLLLIPYLGIVIGVTLYHEREHNYPPGRSLAAGILWPLILFRALVAEGWRIVRGE